MIIGTKYLTNQSDFLFTFHSCQKRTFLAAVVKGVADEPSRKTDGRFKRTNWNIAAVWGNKDFLITSI
jgi:hypothetical protein